MSFGDFSDKLRVGDWVLAIGNLFGLGGTVTAGIYRRVAEILAMALMMTSSQRMRPSIAVILAARCLILMVTLLASIQQYSRNLAAQLVLALLSRQTLLNV